MESIEYKLHNVNTRFKSFSRVTFIIILALSLFILTFIFHFWYDFFGKYDKIWFDYPSIKKEGIISYFILSIILAPILETLLNQSLPYYLLNKIKYLNERSYLILLTSALFFGLLHFYSLFYIFYAFLLGLVFMYGYMIRIKTDKKTFYLIAISHSLVNLAVFIINVSNLP